MPALVKTKAEEGSPHELIEEFRKIIPTSKRLAEDAEEFCGELEGLLDEEPEPSTAEEFARFLRDNILDREPDATLRKKLERFTDAIIMDKTSLEDIGLKL